jgi:catechol 2,3-dioxygenase-like lactoylglutathione lyase family enzyme
MIISHLDHLVLTVKDIKATARFYESVLGMTIIHFGNGRIALQFGTQKINLHQAGQEFEPKALRPTPGSADLCFLLDTDIHDAVQALAAKDVPIIDGPVERTGATGKILSLYIRDLDDNLIELSELL